MILIWPKLRANCLNNNIKSKNLRRKNPKLKTKSFTKLSSFSPKIKDILKRKKILTLLKFSKIRLRVVEEMSRKRNSIRSCTAMHPKKELTQRAERKLQAELR